MYTVLWRYGDPRTAEDRYSEHLQCTVYCVGTVTPRTAEDTPNTSSEDVSMATDAEDEEVKVGTLPVKLSVGSLN